MSCDTLAKRADFKLFFEEGVGIFPDLLSFLDWSCILNLLTLCRITAETIRTSAEQVNSIHLLKQDVYETEEEEPIDRFLTDVAKAQIRHTRLLAWQTNGHVAFVVPLWRRSKSLPLSQVAVFTGKLQATIVKVWQPQTGYDAFNFEGAFLQMPGIPDWDGPTPCVTAGQKLVVVGGADDFFLEKNMLSVKAFDMISGRRWQTVHFCDSGQIPAMRSDAAVCAIPGGFFMHGGLDEDSTLMHDIWIFKWSGPVHGTWTRVLVEGGQFMRQKHAAVALNSTCILVHGGCIEPRSDSWRPLGDMWTFTFTSSHRGRWEPYDVEGQWQMQGHQIHKMGPLLVFVVGASIPPSHGLQCVMAKIFWHSMRCSGNSINLGLQLNDCFSFLRPHESCMYIVMGKGLMALSLQYCLRHQTRRHGICKYPGNHEDGNKHEDGYWDGDENEDNDNSTNEEEGEEIVQEVARGDIPAVVDEEVAQTLVDLQWADTVEKRIMSDGAAYHALDVTSSAEPLPDVDPGHLRDHVVEGTDGDQGVELELEDVVHILRFGCNDTEAFRDLLLTGSQMQLCRRDLGSAGYPCVLPSGALIFVTPCQYRIVQQKLNGHELHPFHVVIASRFEADLQCALASLPYKKRPREKVKDRQEVPSTSKTSSAEVGMKAQDEE